MLHSLWRSHVCNLWIMHASLKPGKPWMVNYVSRSAVRDRLGRTHHTVLHPVPGGLVRNVECRPTDVSYLTTGLFTYLLSCWLHQLSFWAIVEPPLIPSLCPTVWNILPCQLPSPNTLRFCATAAWRSWTWRRSSRVGRASEAHWRPSTLPLLSAHACSMPCPALPCPALTQMDHSTLGRPENVNVQMRCRQWLSHRRWHLLITSPVVSVYLILMWHQNGCTKN